MTTEASVFNEVEKEYPDYLRDESRMVGTADSISFPKTEEEIQALVRQAGATNVPVTVQGARTGIAGGAVPHGGLILNLSRMNGILGLGYDETSGHFTITVQPGILLSELQSVLASKEFETTGWAQDSLDALEAFKTADMQFFSPDPTETGAAIGGMAGANASGAQSFHYGATRAHIRKMRVVLADGTILDLARGREKATGRSFELNTISGMLPALTMPTVKSAAGYFIEEDMDLLDLFIGSEGTLGIISEVTLSLLPAPKSVWGIMMFFPSEEKAVEFVKKDRDLSSEGACLVALELFDSHALDLLRKQKETNPAFKEIPNMPGEWHTGIYVEYHGETEDAVEEAVMEMSEIMAECSGDEESTWLASDDKERQRLKKFRHAIPEAVNLTIDERKKNNPDITKLGTDLAVPDAELENVLKLYNDDLQSAGLEYVKFGHIGDNHLHVNILPATTEQYQQGKELYLKWAKTVVEMGGTVSAEHGIGKLKTAMLEVMYGADGVGQMRELKHVFDPQDIFSQGNLFPVNKPT